MTAGGDRPIPVRSVVPPPASGADSRETPAPAPPPPGPPPRLLETGQGRWEVIPAGISRSGHIRDAGALLLLVRFNPVDGEAGENREDRENREGRKDSEAGETGTPGPRRPREGLAVARSLDDLSDDALEDLLGRARPLG
jgi:hypothetical protein